MKVLLDTKDFGITVGISLTRWFVGISYEPQGENVRGVVFRLGPLWLVMVHRLNA